MLRALQIGRRELCGGAAPSRAVENGLPGDFPLMWRGFVESIQPTNRSPVSRRSPLPYPQPPPIFFLAPPPAAAAFLPVPSKVGW